MELEEGYGVGDEDRWMHKSETKYLIETALRLATLTPHRSSCLSLINFVLAEGLLLTLFGILVGSTTFFEAPHMKTCREQR